MLAGTHPVGKHEHPNRMDKYERHVSKYEFFSFRFPVPLSSIGSFDTTNNLSINGYGVENDEKVIYPIRVSQTVVPDRHVDGFTMNVIVYNILLLLETLVGWSVVS